MGSADHRWLSIAFTVAVIVNIVAVVGAKYSSRRALGGLRKLDCCESPECHPFEKAQRMGHSRHRR
jgi:hypothetical protein